MTEYITKARTKAITFDELVNICSVYYGANIVNNMPWSFKWNGYAVTHENDGCYLLMKGPHDYRFEKGQVFVYDNGPYADYLQTEQQFLQIYEPFSPNAMTEERLQEAIAANKLIIKLKHQLVIAKQMVLKDTGLEVGNGVAALFDVFKQATIEKLEAVLAEYEKIFAQL